MLGINESVPATCFPAEVTTAASWDINLLERVGSAIGQEAKVQNIGLVLGPGPFILLVDRILIIVKSLKEERMKKFTGWLSGKHWRMWRQ